MQPRITAVILTSIALNLYINLVKIEFFTMLSFEVHEQNMYLFRCFFVSFIRILLFLNYRLYIRYIWFVSKCFELANEVVF